MFMNYSEEERYVLYSAGSQEENIFFSIFYIIVFVVSVPSNALALWVFSLGKGSSPSKIFLLNLAIADMSYVLVLPMRVVYHLSGNNWPLGEASCRLVGFLFFLNLYCSMYLMTCISLDRLLAIIQPLKRVDLRRITGAKVACVILWVTITISMAPVLFSRQTVSVPTETRNVTVCHQLYLEKTSSRALVSTAVAFSVPLVTLTVSYILILYKLAAMTSPGSTSVRRKARRMIVLTLLNFLVAIVPYHAHRVLYILRRTSGPLPDDVIRSLALGNRLTSALTCLSGVLDPVMYFFLAKNYQKTLLQLCGRTADKDQGQKLQSTT